MAVATNATIKTQILLGTFPDNTIESDGSNTFDFEQYERRRRYPSCEITTVQPESTEETKESTIFTVGFEIKYFVRNLGARTDEVATQKSVEDVIIAQLESMVLQDHKVTFESKIWKREQVQRTRNHPAYIISVLRITIRQVTQTTATPDGTLTFILAGSTVTTPPGADYLYTDAYNVDIQEGFRTIEEKNNSSNVPKFFAGDFSGRFICDIHVKAADLGSTGDKLNNFVALRAVGEKPIIQFDYANKTADEPTASTITETLTIIPETINRRYLVRDVVVFRLIGTIIVPSVIVVT